MIVAAKLSAIGVGATEPSATSQCISQAKVTTFYGVLGPRVTPTTAPLRLFWVKQAKPESVTAGRLLLIGCVALLSATFGVNAAAKEYTTRVAYLLHCGGCHLSDGRGNPPEVPDLRHELGRIITLPGGRDYLLRVPGASQAPVSDAQLADIMNWVLSEFNRSTLPKKFSPYTESEVSASRPNVLTDPLKHRARLWAKQTDYSEHPDNRQQ